jgi:ATP/maltotriose-dependent transcriptional regulator MalT
MQEAQRAHEVLPRAPGQPIVGAAFYQMAELHRLRGEFAQAEEAYRQAAQWWRKPQPGPALLRLEQGQVDAARAAIRRMLDEAQDPNVRATCLGPCVEILLAAGDAVGARTAADEVARIARELDAPFLHAVTARARGEVLLAAGDARAALPLLRAACTAWLDLGAPYEAARCRVLVGRVCRALDDHDAARVEFEAARQAFAQLGAKPDLARLDALTPREPAPGGLSAREVEVLRFIAAGKSNRDIAGELGISEKTVARHVSNIFTKLGLGSRTAAAAYAYRHGVAQP